MKTTTYISGFFGIITVCLFLFNTSYAQQQMKINTEMSILQEPVRADVVTDPQDASACQGDSALFTIIATGDVPITYQWLFDGTALPFTDDTLILYNVQITDAGEYKCVATNDCGSDTSGFAMLTVFITPVPYNVGGGGGFCAGAGGVDITLDGSDIGINYELVLDGTPTGIVMSGNGSGLIWSNITTSGQYTINAVDPVSTCLLLMNGFVMISEQPAVTLTLSNQFEPTCYNACDGSLHFTATGSSGYTYDSGAETNATGSFYGLCDGTYMITVTDVNGCSDSEAGTLTQPSEITVSVVSQTSATCSGICNGTAVINYAGGTGTINVEWSNGETSASALSLCGGSNYVTVTDQNLCYANLEVIISEPSVYIINESITHANCYNYNDGEISLAVSGSNPPYTYTWSDMQPHGSSATGLIAGTFTITISDNNLCDTIVTYFLSQPDTLVINESLFHPSCLDNDGQIITSPTGGTSGYLYNWSNGVITSDITGLSSGIYNLTVTDMNGCIATGSFDLFPVSINPVIKGQVSYTGGNFGAGEAIVKVFNEIDIPVGSILFEYYDEAFTNSNGFEIQIPVDNYILRGVITSPSAYPNIYSTYFHGTPAGFSTSWEDAEILSLGCDDTLNINIVMDETPPASGPVTFSGAIYYWDSGTKGVTTEGDKAAGEPVEGAEVFIEQQPNDNPVAYAVSGSDGAYVVSGIETGYTYDMIVDIPGIPLLNTYTDIMVDAATTIILNLNFFVDTTNVIGGIFIDSTSGISSQLLNIEKLNIYPNPAKENLFVEVETVGKTRISIILSDMTGKDLVILPETEHNKGEKTYIFPLKSIVKGSYILKVKSGNTVLIKKLIIE